MDTPTFEKFIEKQNHTLSVILDEIENFKTDKPEEVEILDALHIQLEMALT